MFVANLSARRAKSAKSNPLKPQVEVGILCLSKCKARQLYPHRVSLITISQLTMEWSHNTQALVQMDCSEGWMSQFHNWRDGPRF